jgi:flagellin
MALAIATNNAALNAAASASSVNRDMETSMARLSSGKRINSASDDAAGVAIASRLSSEIRGTDQAIRNSLDGQALINTAEGAHSEIENILQRMREVAVQSANDTNNTQDRANLQAEMNAMGIEIDRIAGTTTWAGANLMNGGQNGKDFSFQVGTAVGDKNQIKVNIDGMTMSDLSIGQSTTSAAYALTANAFTISSSDGAKADAVGTFTASPGAGEETAKYELKTFETGTDGTLTVLNSNLSNKTTVITLDGDSEQNTVDNINAALSDQGVQAYIADDGIVMLNLNVVAAVTTASTNIDVSTGANARTGITKLDDAIKEVNVQRSELGAVSNRLNHTVNNLTNISSNLSAAKGGIEDADFALETTNLAKNQILQQASTAMLAQANASKQNVLSLLQGRA